MSKIKSKKQFKEGINSAYETMRTRDEAKACSCLLSFCLVVELGVGGQAMRLTGIALGLLRPLRGSGFALGQPDAFGAGEYRIAFSRLQH